MVCRRSDGARLSGSIAYSMCNARRDRSSRVESTSGTIDHHHLFSGCSRSLKVPFNKSLLLSPLPFHPGISGENGAARRLTSHSVDSSLVFHPFSVSHVKPFGNRRSERTNERKSQTAKLHRVKSKRRRERLFIEIPPICCSPFIQERVSFAFSSLLRNCERVSCAFVRGISKILADELESFLELRRSLAPISTGNRIFRMDGSLKRDERILKHRRLAVCLCSATR